MRRTTLPLGLLPALFLFGFGSEAAELTVDQRSATPGNPVKITLSGFTPNEGVFWYVDKRAFPGVTLGADGTYQGDSPELPRAGLVAGRHWLTAIGQRSHAVAQAPVQVETSWTQFGYGSDRKGYNPYEQLISADNATGLRLLWRRRYTCGGELYNAPAVAYGFVYVNCPYDGRRAYGTSAVSETDGAKHWSTPTDGFGLSSVAVADGLVFSGTREDQTLHALDAKRGTQRWANRILGGVVASPLVVDDWVYAVTLKGRLYAFDTLTGQSRLNLPISSHKITAAPAAARGVLYVASSDGNLYALDLRTGATRWTASTGGPIYAAPVVGPTLVYVQSSDGNLYAFDLVGGAPRWAVPTGNGAPVGDTVATQPALAGNRLYLVSRQRFIRALRADDGSEDWTLGFSGQVLSSAAVANGLIYVGTAEGLVYALTPDGSVAANVKEDVGPPILNPMVVANNRLYFGDTGNTLYAYGLPGVSGDQPQPDPEDIRGE